MPDGITFNPSISSAGSTSAPPSGGGNPVNTAVGTTVAANVVGQSGHLMRERWADSFGAWATRTLMGDVGDRLTGAYKRGVGGTINDGRVGYERLLQLNGGAPLEKVSLSNLSWQGYRNAVSNNVRPLGTALKNTIERKPGGLMQGVTAKSYLRDTVYKGNINDIKQLFSKDSSSGKQIGTGLAKAGGLAIMAFDIFKGAKSTYDMYSAQEDGSFGSKARTWMETGKTVLKKTIKNGIAWEAAGAGFALGSALLPVAGPVGLLGGIAVGALTGALVKTGLDKIMPDTTTPPEASPATEAESIPITSSSSNESVNPFAQAGTAVTV